jgi:hypothetical protein
MLSLSSSGFVDLSPCNLAVSRAGPFFISQARFSTFGQTDPPAVGQKDSHPLDRLAGTSCRRRAPKLVSHADIPAPVPLPYSMSMKGNRNYLTP